MALRRGINREGQTIIIPCMKCGMVIDGWCDCQFNLRMRDGPQQFYNGGSDAEGTTVVGKVASVWYDCKFCGSTLEVTNSEDICESCEQWLESNWPD